MGYQLNPELVERRRHLLINLERGIRSSWVVTADLKRTRQYAFEIREALWIASQHPERFPKLAAAHRNFSIHVVEAGRIEARPKTPKSEPMMVESSIPELPKPAGKVTAAEVVEVWQNRQPSNDPIGFTDTLLPLEELEKLHAWASAWTPKLMLLVDEENKLLTLTPVDPTVAEFAWHPPKADDTIQLPEGSEL